MRKLLISGIACLAMSGVANAQECDVKSDKTPVIVEIVQFRLTQNTTEQQFLKAAKATMPYLCSVEGFIRRNLSKDENGLWTDYVEWTDKKVAKTAAENAMKREDMMPFMMTIDPNSISMKYSDIASLK